MVDAMDSKSISCDGSRGSSPRPGTNAADPLRADSALARALLPVLLHELNNHTQYLSALGALEGAGDPLPNRGAGLARTAQEVADMGWLLGLCAGGHGADLLRDRTEAGGLAPLVRCVRKALRRVGRDLERAERGLPELSPRLGWRGAWRVGEILFAFATVVDGPLAWEIAADGDGLVLTCRAEPSAVVDPAVTRAIPAAERGPGWIRFRIVPGDGP